MTPRQFFDEVAEPNARLAVANHGDLRRAVNAMMTVDAFFGILHAALRQSGINLPTRDDVWKGQLASQNSDYRLLRDTAYAIKHGELTQGTRIVHRPDQLFAMPGGFQPGAFSSAFDTGQVWIETAGTDYRANEVIGGVVDFARSQLIAHGL